MVQRADTGRRNPLRRKRRAAAILLACTAIGQPMPLLAQTLSPSTTRPALALGSNPQSATSQTRNIYSDPTVDPYATDSQADAADGTGNRSTAVTTGVSGSGSSDPVLEGRVISNADDQIESRQNPKEPSIDGASGIRSNDGDTAAGIRLGTFVLRPSVSQSINSESTRTKGFGGDNERRSFLETGVRGTLDSDWSRHALKITGEGLWQKNIGGTGETDPSVRLDADLQLDISHDTTAHITGGYRFSREDTTDPNAILGAEDQAGVNQFSSGASIERDFGILRGLAAVNLDRSTYTSVRLSDGSTLSLADRNQTTAGARARLGYELSPALIPFLELHAARSFYDQKRDSSGYARSSDTYGGKIGVEVDLGEKLRGELGIGYEKVAYDDSRLASIGTVTADGSITWSPLRGTDVNLGLQTTVEDSTTPGLSGSIAYTLLGGVQHDLGHDILARLTASTTLRDYPSGSGITDTTSYAAGAGLTWGISRYLDMTGDLAYELSGASSGADTQKLRIGLGLQLKR